MDSILFIYDIFTQQHWLLVKFELIFTNTCKDHVKSSDACLRQYIFLQIRIYFMLKYQLIARQYQILFNEVCLFTFKKREKSRQSLRADVCQI